MFIIAFVVAVALRISILRRTRIWVTLLSMSCCVDDVLFNMFFEPMYFRVIASSFVNYLS